MNIVLPAALRRQIIDFFVKLPNMQGEKAFQALLYAAGLDAAIENQIDFDVPAAQFFPLLVKALCAFGTLADGRQALVAVLEAAQPLGGQEHQATCRKLVQALGRIGHGSPSS